jgi:hypothetical protein
MSVLRIGSLIRSVADAIEKHLISPVLFYKTRRQLLIIPLNSNKGYPPKELFMPVKR